MAGPVLHLGVLQQPYRLRGLDTYDVAKILESKYGVMAAFVRVHQKDIAKELESTYAGFVETVMSGARPTGPWSSAFFHKDNPIGFPITEHEFRDFIASKEAERVGIPGTPTKAALMGVNHGRAHPYRKSNPRRPSFLDTGMYMNNFKAWVDV